MVAGGDRGGVEDILKRIHAHRGVIATMTINDEGIPIRTSLDNATTVHHAALLHPLTMKAQSTVRDLDPENDLVLLRIRSEKQEIIVATENGYTLIAIQKTSE